MESPNTLEPRHPSQPQSTSAQHGYPCPPRNFFSEQLAKFRAQKVSKPEPCEPPHNPEGRVDIDRRLRAHLRLIQEDETKAREAAESMRLMSYSVKELVEIVLAAEKTKIRQGDQPQEASAEGDQGIDECVDEDEDPLGGQEHSSRTPARSRLSKTSVCLAEELFEFADGTIGIHYGRSGRCPNRRAD